MAWLFVALGFILSRMDELQISGKRFISSRRIAREHGYTSDYIGQLIRGGKIVGQKVGRAWYVEEHSFNIFLGTGGTEIKTVSVVEEAAPQVHNTPEIKTAIPAPMVDTMPTIEISAQPIATETVVEKTTTEVSPFPALPANASVTTTLVQKESVSSIPLRIVKTDSHVENKKDLGGLRYYADESPSLPQIGTYKNEIATILTVQKKELETKKVFKPADSSRASHFFVGGLATLGISFFILVSFVSSMVSLNLNFNEEGVATAFYSLDW